jgi:L-fucose isomerase-like protein
MTTATRPVRPAAARPAAARPGTRPTVSSGTTSTLPAATLLVLARRGLAEAASTTVPAERYAAAHLAALRAAAAVLACRARPAAPGVRRSRPTSAWVLLAAVAPELGEWAAFFAAGARKRAAAEAGLPASVSAREADDLLRDAETFLAVAETTIGLSSQLLLASG